MALLALCVSLCVCVCVCVCVHICGRARICRLVRISTFSEQLAKGHATGWTELTVEQKLKPR